ncbi:HDIG domain-containing protein [Paenibacillus sp. N1-5-1-14]|uniref:HD family phosphohydrolase n=1 Tax=Paenibacillus radicibacter TaxID=2972488 RepID=UPI002158B122|nr:HDIG domain-containing metalloprotein [Paenibacillus radicibacter]MCR8641975.1 HDIG domain-containing protein [Paenibacillus radicibacter]
MIPLTPTPVHASDNQDGRLQGWRYSKWVRFTMFVVLGIMFYFSLINPLVPQTYNIVKGQRSDKTIYAPKQLENKEATDQAKEDAAKKVMPVYKTVNFKNEDIVDAIFFKINSINSDTEAKYEEKVNMYRTVIPSIIQEAEEQMIKGFVASGLYGPELIKEIRQKIDDQTYRISDERFYKFPRLTKEEVAEMLPVAREIVYKLMSDQITDAQVTRSKVVELVNTSNLSKNTARELVTEICRSVITPNRFYDDKGTDEAKAKVKETVKPVLINKGDLLVTSGELITDDLYEQLKEFGLLKDKANYWPHAGLFILVLLFCFLIFMLVRQSRQPIRHNNAQLLMLFVIIAISIIIMKIFAIAQNLEYQNLAYLAPTAVGAMLIAILLEAPIAYIAAILLSILASIIFNMDHLQPFDYRYGFVTLVVSFVSVFSIQRASQRSSILKAGLVISLAGVVAIGCLLMLDGGLNRNESLLSLGYGVGGGLLTSVLVIGLLPFFETAFGILSPLKMVELSNPNHPLLRKLLTETPGTYHHSIMVGNLAEAAAESIGADGLLCRVGSYYHDIGKTKRPSYFIENQTSIENPHDRIDPELSTSIITAHPRDGVEMLKEYKMPKAIRDIAEQHHGTTLLQYFYHKAKQQAAEGEEVLEEDFRYPGPKAQSKEAAVVGIADCVEAAVRSMRNPTMEQIDSMVRKIMKSRLDDGQFNECDLTLKELDTIAKTLNETLLGIFHSRIEYPSDPKAEGK